MNSDVPSGNGPQSGNGWNLFGTALKLPSMTIRQLVAVLFLATALPLLALILFMYLQMVTNVRQTARDSLMSSARTLGTLVESEFDTHLAIAQSLATADSLQRNDLLTFHRNARKALALLPGAWLYVVDPAGKVILSTLREAGDPPPADAPKFDLAAFSTLKPYLSDIVQDAHSKRRLAYLEVPVLTDGKAAYALAISLNPDRFHALLIGKVNERAAVAVLDRQHRFLARIPDHERRLGTLAAESWRAAIATAVEGVFQTVTLEGVPSLTAYVTIRNGWIVGISLPTGVVDTPVYRILVWLASIGLAALLVSIGFGFALSQIVARVLSSLASAARRVGEGNFVAPPTLPIVEADAIGKALSSASQQLAAQEAVLRESEIRFRGTFQNTTVGIAHMSLAGTFLEANQQLSDILGYSSTELLNLSILDVTHLDDHAAEISAMRQLKAGEVKDYTLEKRFVRKDGSNVWSGVTVSPQPDAAGRPKYYIKVVQDITERKAAQEHQRFLLRELAHRSKNQLSIILSMASQTARGAFSVGDFQERFSRRIQGLAVSTDLLLAQNWQGARMLDLVQQHLEPFSPGKSRLLLDGPEVSVSSEATQAIGLALHELATNCLKYGAWSSPVGLVTVRWNLQLEAPKGTRCLQLTWQERDGPPTQPPEKKGFGTIVIEQMAAQKLQGEVELSYAADGLCWTLTIPDAHFTVESKSRRAQAR